MRRLLLFLLLIASAAQAGLPTTLSLDEALALAREQQPSLSQARATARVARARAREALAPVLPAVSMALAYSRATANFVARPGSVPQGISSNAGLSLDSYDYWSGNLTATATLWDFGQGWNRYQAALSSADAQAAQVRAAEVAAGLQVRTAWFGARAQRELVRVAEENLRNTEAHLAQVEGFVKVGTHPEIDLAQNKADRANARLGVVNARNAYVVARARLSQAIGLQGSARYEVEGDGPGPLELEGESSDELFEKALSSRPEAAALEAQLRGQELLLRSVRGAFLPTLGAQAGVNVGARSLDRLVPNVSGQLTLNWQLYQGGLTQAQVEEDEAALVQLRSVHDSLRLQVRLDVEQALAGVVAAREAVDVAQEGELAAKERLRLAEGRYKAGAGNALELGDAQVAHFAASAQRVQAVYGLATARAQLAAAVGLP